MANWTGRENLQLATALFAEFLGTMLFQYFGGVNFGDNINGGADHTPPCVDPTAMLQAWLTACS